MTRLERQVLAVIGEHLTIAPRVYERLPGLAKAEIDATLARLQMLRLVVLHEHSNPLDSDRVRMIQADGRVFVGACRRLP